MQLTGLLLQPSYATCKHLQGLGCLGNGGRAAMAEEKFCRPCGRWLPLDSFGACNGKPHGYWCCKACNCKQSRASKQKKKKKKKKHAAAVEVPAAAADVDRTLAAYTKAQFKRVYKRMGWLLRWRRSKPGVPVMGPGFNRTVLRAMQGAL